MIYRDVLLYPKTVKHRVHTPTVKLHAFVIEAPFLIFIGGKFKETCSLCAVKVITAAPQTVRAMSPSGVIEIVVCPVARSQVASLVKWKSIPVSQNSPGLVPNTGLVIVRVLEVTEEVLNTTLV